MKESTRNLVVGLTVLVAMGIFASMTLIFQELPSLFSLGYTVRVAFPDTGGVNAGADVLLSGKRIGHVSDLQFADPQDPTKGIAFAMIINREVTLPGAVNFYTQGHGLMGSASIEVRLDNKAPGTARKQPGTDRPLASIPRDNSMLLQGGQSAGGGGSNLIPQDVQDELKETMGNLNRVAKSVDAFFAEPGTQPASQPGSHPSSQPATGQARPNIYLTLGRFDRVMDDLDVFLGSKENQKNLHDSLVNLERVTRGFIDDADRLGRFLSFLESAAGKMDRGEGTLGKLINDPALYNTLTDAARQLKDGLQQFQDLMAQWKARGMGIRLK